jgi:hypothetical protein
VSANVFRNILASWESAVADYCCNIGRFGGCNQGGYRTVRNSHGHYWLVVSTQSNIPKRAENVARLQESRRDNCPSTFTVASEINQQDVVTAPNKKSSARQHNLSRVIDPVSDDDGPSWGTRSRKPSRLEGEYHLSNRMKLFR